MALSEREQELIRAAITFQETRAELLDIVNEPITGPRSAA
jgi:hypothetical protein